MPIIKPPTFSIPYPGFVDIHLYDMTMRFSAPAIRQAIENTTKNREHFATEEAYQDVLALYRQALKLLEAEPR